MLNGLSINGESVSAKIISFIYIVGNWKMIYFILQQKLFLQILAINGRLLWTESEILGAYFHTVRLNQPLLSTKTSKDHPTQEMTGRFSTC